MKQAINQSSLGFSMIIVLWISQGNKHWEKHVYCKKVEKQKIKKTGADRYIMIYLYGSMQNSFKRRCKKVPDYDRYIMIYLYVGEPTNVIFSFDTVVAHSEE